jgi:transposase
MHLLDAGHAWLAGASRSKLDPFVKLARTIRRHRAGILAASRLGLSNGRLEALNSRLRLMSHRSLGFHSPPPPHRTRLPLLRRRRHRAPAMNFTTE